MNIDSVIDRLCEARVHPTIRAGEGHPAIAARAAQTAPQMIHSQNLSKLLPELNGEELSVIVGYIEEVVDAATEKAYKDGQDNIVSAGY